MKPQTRINIETAFELIEKEKHSLEYNIQWVMDYAKVDHDCVMKYIREEHERVNGL